MSKVIRLALLTWIGLFGLGTRAQDTISAPGGVAAGRDIIDTTINIGISPDQVAVITEALIREQKLTDDQRKIITDLESKLGVSGGALQAFFRIGRSRGAARAAGSEACRDRRVLQAGPRAGRGRTR